MIISSMENTLTKKRILFQKDKDACFLTYNLFIILDFLDCYTSESAFNDYRKLSYIIDFTSSDTLVNIFNKVPTLQQKETELLRNSYLTSSSRQNQIFLLIQALKQRGLICLEFDESNPLKNKLYIANKDLITNIIDREKFHFEYKNIKSFNNSPSIRGLKRTILSTLLDKIYTQKGVKIWQI